MLQTSLLKHNRRLKQRDTLPLNADRGAGGDRKSPSVVQGQAAVGSLGMNSQKLKPSAHLHSFGVGR